MPDYSKLASLLRGQYAAGPNFYAGGGAPGDALAASQRAADAARAAELEQQQRAAVTAREQAMAEARNAGFESPEAMQQALLAQERYKTDAPVRAAEAASQGRIAAADVNAQAAMDKLRELLGVYGGAGSDRSLSVAGVGSIGATPKASTTSRPMVVPKHAQDLLQKARDAYQGGGAMGTIRSFLGMGPSQDTTAAYRGALENALRAQGPTTLNDISTFSGQLQNMPGATLDERLTNYFNSPGAQYTPNDVRLTQDEADYLRLLLGVQ